MTLAWFTPIRPRTRKYRAARLWCDTKEAQDALQLERLDVCQKTARRGTLQHDVFAGDRACPLDEDACVSLQVNCRNDAGGQLQGRGWYGLAVTLAVEDERVAVYDEIRARIRLRPRVRPRASA